MIDTCIGNDRQREFPVFCNMQTTFLEDLAAAGFPPASVNTVLCTHLHFDHVGWNTRKVERQVGADIPAGALSLRQAGVRALAAPA